MATNSAIKEEPSANIEKSNTEELATISAEMPKELKTIKSQMTLEEPTCEPAKENREDEPVSKASVESSEGDFKDSLTHEGPAVMSDALSRDEPTIEEPATVEPVVNATEEEQTADPGTEKERAVDTGKIKTESRDHSSPKCDVDGNKVNGEKENVVKDCLEKKSSDGSREIETQPTPREAEQKQINAAEDEVLRYRGSAAATQSSNVPDGENGEYNNAAHCLDSVEEKSLRVQFSDVISIEAQEFSGNTPDNDDTGGEKGYGWVDSFFEDESVQSGADTASISVDSYNSFGSSPPSFFEEEDVLLDYILKASHISDIVRYVDFCCSWNYRLFAHISKEIKGDPIDKIKIARDHETGNPTFECDYESNPEYNLLFKAIEAKQWKFALRIFEEDYDILEDDEIWINSSLDEMELISRAKALCMTWVFRKDKSGNLRWRLLPIHAATLLDAPPNLIERMLREYPDGASCKDDRGNLPIVLAFKAGASEEVIDLLLDAFPKGIRMTDHKGRTLLQCAAENSKPKRGILTCVACAVTAEKAAYEKKVKDMQEIHDAELKELKEEYARWVPSTENTDYNENGEACKFDSERVIVSVQRDDSIETVATEPAYMNAEAEPDWCFEYSGRSDPSLECNYDSDPEGNILFRAIEKRKWDDALAMFRNPRKNKKDERVFDTKALARTWVSRREVDGKLRWRLLPIHAAIVFDAPFAVVEKTLQAYPDGARCKDDQGSLPIHMAFKLGKSEEIISILLETFPKGFDAMDGKGRTALQCAAFGTRPKRGIIRFVTRAIKQEKAKYERQIEEMRENHSAVFEDMKKEYTEKRISLKKKRITPNVKAAPEEIQAKNESNGNTVLQQLKDQHSNQLNLMKEMTEKLGGRKSFRRFMRRRSH